MIKSGNSKLVQKFKEAASKNNDRIHVIATKKGWSVKKEGASRAISVSETREAAVKTALKVSSIEKVVVHKKDGSVDSNCYRNDRF